MARRKKVPNPYIAGPPLTGEAGFFGREDIFQFVRETLTAGQKVIVLFGQRRIGKTSLLHQLQRPVHTPEGFHPVYFDLQGKAGQPLTQVLAQLAQEIAASFDFFPSADRFGIAREASDFDRLFLPAVYDALGDEMLLLLFDEFDVLGDETHTRAAASTLFPYLQGLTEKAPKLAFIFIVGRRLEELPVYYGSIFKAAHFYRVSLLDRTGAVRLITEPATGILAYEEGAIEKILSLTANHPYLTQVLCFELFATIQRQSRSRVTAQDVDVVVERAIRRGETGLAWFWDGLPQAERFIFSAIAHVTEAQGLATRDQIRQVLRQHGIEFLGIELIHAPDRLIEWEMLKETEPGRYCFVVEMVRRWVADKHPVEEAKRELEHAVPRATHLYEAGRSAQEEGDLGSAIRHFGDALKANPAHLRARLSLAYALFEKDQLEESLIEFEKAYRLDPDSARDGWVKALVEFGKTAYRQERWRDAQSRFEQALTLNPQHEEVKTWLQEAKEQKQLAEWYAGAQDSILGEAWSKAVDFLTKIVDRKAAYKEAAALLDLASRQVRLATLYEKAGQRMAAGDWNGANGVLGQIVEQDASYRDARKLLDYCVARDCETKAEWAAAALLYGEIMASDRSFRDVHVRLEGAREQAKLQWLYDEAMVRIELEKWGHAVEYLRQIQDIDPAYRDVERRLQEAKRQRDLAEAYESGVRHMSHRQWGKAIEVLQVVVDQSPDYRDTELKLKEALDRREEHYAAVRRWSFVATTAFAVTFGLIVLTFGGVSLAVEQLGRIFRPSVIVEGSSTLPATLVVSATAMSNTPAATGTPTMTLTPRPVPTLPLPKAGSILFTSLRDGNAELYIMNADGSEQQRLTHDEALDQWPRRSPSNDVQDGSKIVFVSNRGPGGVDALYLTDIYYSPPIRLTSGDRPERRPAWSPDGEWIVYESQNEAGDWDIYAVRPDGESSSQLLIAGAGQDGAPAWSPDGKWIAFHSDRTGQLHIWGQEILNMQTLTPGEVRKFTEGDGSHKYPAWSPDGQQLAYTLEQEEQSDVYILTLDGDRKAIGEPRLLAVSDERTSWPAWYPGGGWVAYVSQVEGLRQICVVPADVKEGAEKERRCLTEEKENLWPDWSVEFLFPAWPTPTPTPTDTPKPVPQPTNTPTPTATFTPTPTFTPSPTPPPLPKIAYVSTQDGDPEIYVMDANGSNPTQLTFNFLKDESPSWSPNGWQIVFMREIRGNQSLWIMSARGEDARELDIEFDDVVPPNDDEMWPAWSPNGKWIAFQANWYGDNNIWIVNIESKQVLPLTSGPGSDEMPHWSADGQRVVYHSNASGVYQLWAVEIAFDEAGERVVSTGQKPERLTLNQNNNRCPVWSPVGEMLAFWSDQDGNWEIYVKKDATQIDDTGPYLRMTDSTFEERLPTWSPGADKIAFVSNREDNLQIFVVSLNDVIANGALGAKWTQLTRGKGDHYDPAWWVPPR